MTIYTRRSCTSYDCRAVRSVPHRDHISVILHISTRSYICKECRIIYHKFVLIRKATAHTYILIEWTEKEVKFKYTQNTEKSYYCMQLPLICSTCKIKISFSTCEILIPYSTSRCIYFALANQPNRNKMHMQRK